MPTTTVKAPFYIRETEKVSATGADIAYGNVFIQSFHYLLWNEVKFIALVLTQDQRGYSNQT